MEISWTDRVRNEELLHTVKEERNILHKITRRKAKWIGDFWRRNCLLKHVTREKDISDERTRKKTWVATG